MSPHSYSQYCTFCTQYSHLLLNSVDTPYFSIQLILRLYNVFTEVLDSPIRINRVRCNLTSPLVSNQLLELFHTLFTLFSHVDQFLYCPHQIKVGQDFFVKNTQTKNNIEHFNQDIIHTGCCGLYSFNSSQIYCLILHFLCHIHDIYFSITFIRLHLQTIKPPSSLGRKITRKSRSFIILDNICR